VKCVGLTPFHSFDACRVISDVGTVAWVECGGIENYLIQVARITGPDGIWTAREIHIKG